MSQYPMFLERLEGVDRHTALSFFEDVEVMAGEMLMRGEQESGCLAYVVQGAVEVHAAHAVVGRAGPGEWVGETAMFPAGRRRATVFATEDCRILALPTEAYVAMRRGEHPMIPDLERAVLHDQLSRMRRQGDTLAALSAGAPHLEPPRGLLSVFAAELGPGGLLSRAQLDVPGRLRELGIVEPEETDRTAQGVARPFSVRTYAPGTMLCAEGEAGDAMFVLLEGRVEVVKQAADGRPQRITHLEPGAAFGQASLHEGRPRMASCVAASQVTVLELDREGWDALASHSGPVGSSFRRAMIRVLADQLARTNLEIARVAGEPTRLDFAAASWEATGAW